MSTTTSTPATNTQQAAATVTALREVLDTLERIGPPIGRVVAVSGLLRRDATLLSVAMESRDDARLLASALDLNSSQQPHGEPATAWLGPWRDGQIMVYVAALTE